MASTCGHTSDRDRGRDRGRRRVGGANRGRDGGQSAVLLLLVVAAFGVALAAALADVGRLALDRTRAQTAADAAALASLPTGPGLASAIAAEHGGVVVSWTRGPGAREVTVVVRVGDATATARASDEP